MNSVKLNHPSLKYIRFAQSICKDLENLSWQYTDLTSNCKKNVAKESNKSYLGDIFENEVQIVLGESVVGRIKPAFTGSPKHITREKKVVKKPGKKS